MIAFEQHKRSNDVGRGMTSPPLGSTHGRQHRVLHDITPFRQQKRSSDVGRGMRSSPLRSTHGRTTSSVACHHSPWTANTVKRRQPWHAIIAFGQHKRSDGVRRCMLSSPLASTHSRTTLGVEYHHRLWVAHTVERRRAWHAIIAFGQHTRSNDVGRGMPSRILAAHTVERRLAWHAIIAFGLADTVVRRRAWHAIIAHGQETRSNDVGHGMQSSPLGSTDSRTASGVACHHRPWAAQTVGRRRASHAISALGQHRRSAVVGRAMPS